MTLSFPSPEWATACEQAVNASDAYRQAAATWTHGAVALVVNARPEIGLPNPVGIWLDLERGVCRGAKIVSQPEAQRAPFVLTADYARWRQVIRRELGPIAGIMQRKILLQGSLPIMVRFLKAAELLVEATTQVPTRFLDE